jgi:dCMP deaminase
MIDDRTRLAEAYTAALESPDPSTQNGAVLVDWSGIPIARACNHFPYGVKETAERWERPLKYEVIEHAERNAIFLAAQYGRQTHGATLYCPWAACSDCARAIIQAGIKRLVRHKDALERGTNTQRKDWDASISIADQMMLEAGVELVDIEGKITDGIELLHSGETWSP